MEAATTKLSKFDNLDPLQNADPTRQENAEELMFGAAETTGNLERAAELFQVNHLTLVFNCAAINVVKI